MSKTDIVPADAEAFERFLATAETIGEAVDPDDVTRQVITRILGAENVDAVFDDQAATHAKDFLGRPFRLLGAKFNRSSFAAGPSPFYAVLDAVTPDGEPVTITCGAGRVIAQVYKLLELDALPIDVQLEESPRETANGFRIMWLEKAAAAF